MSNYAAQSMYSKYGFVTVEVIKGYYADMEPALVLVLFDLDKPNVWGRVERALGSISIDVC